MMTKYFTDVHGEYLGAFDGAEPPHGAIEVSTPPEHADDTLVGKTWVKSATRTAREAKAAEVAKAKIDTKEDAFVQQFIAMTPAQVVDHVNANVTTLVDAKQLLTKLSLMMLAIAKEQYK